jgi:ubiquitin carboxyl-terminal hydrolase 14
MSLAADEPTEKAGPGLPDNFEGIYELYAVVCHKGRDSDSGHYTGWVRQDGDNWLVFDDDEVVEKTTADILALKGGGDWHMSYLNFYRAIDRTAEDKKREEKEKEAKRA